MTDRLLALRTFVRTAHSGSLSRAARELGLSQPSVSRILSGLEREIGAALLVRTTRAVTLTDAGADYLSRIEPLLSALAEAEHAARGTGELRGTLRIALSASFGVREVVPRLPTFLERHPALRIDLDVSDARQDLIADGVDVALRIGPMSDSSALARKLGRSSSAAPGFACLFATLGSAAGAERPGASCRDHRPGPGGGVGIRQGGSPRFGSRGGSGADGGQ